MIRAAAISMLAAACAHDHAIDRRELGAMKNDSAAISPWAGPEVDPIAATSADAPVAAVVDQVHGMVVQVFAAVDAQNIHVASGVLAGGGIVLTDMRALLFEAPGGGVQPAAEIAVLTSRGAVPARIVGGALDAGVAVLELPEAARALEGPPLAERSSGGDQLLAVRASKQGAAISFEVIGFSIGQSEDALRLRPVQLPVSFEGAPVFDAGGSLAGLLVGASEKDVVLVPSARLMQILNRVPPAPDNHI